MNWYLLFSFAIAGLTSPPAECGGNPDLILAFAGMTENDIIVYIERDSAGIVEK